MFKVIMKIFRKQYLVVFWGYLLLGCSRNIEILSNLCKSYIKANQLNQALNSCQKWTVLAPNMSEDWFRYGFALEKNRNFK